MHFLSRVSQAAALTLFLTLMPAHAGLVTSASGGTTTAFPGGSGCYLASAAVVGGFSMSSTGDWCHDFSGGFSLGGNGTWTGFGLVSDNRGSSLITIDLGALYSSAGGFVNYAPGLGTPFITALAADGTTVLETYDLSTAAPISTPGGVNAGAFRGIQRGSSDIRYLRFGGSFMAMHDITLDSASGVPEPSTFSMLGVTALAIGIARRRSRA